MKWILAAPIAVSLWGAVAAAGPLDSPIPTNPCATPAGTFHNAWVANEIGTDRNGTACAGGGSACAETLIVCTHMGRTGSTPIDLGIDLFTSSGMAVPPGAGALSEVSCGLPAGASAAFVTTGVGLPPPYMGLGAVLLTSGPVAPTLGSLRVVSTNPGKTACDVTLIDTSALVAGFVGPTTIKDVTVTKATASQKGD